MRILIAGVGGIGGVLAARLLMHPAVHSEFTVTLLARNENAEVLEKEGLKFNDESQTGEVVLKNLDVVRSLEGQKPFDVIFMSAKRPDLPALADAVLPFSTSHTLAIALVNGLPLPSTLKNWKEQREILNSVMYIASSRTSPGVFKQTSPFFKIFVETGVDNSLELSPNARALEALCNGCGIEFKYSENISLKMWEKFLFLCPIASVTAWRSADFGQVLSEPESKELLCQCIDEILELAAAYQIHLDPALRENTLKTVEKFPPQSRTSLERDISQGRPSELEFITGEVVRLAREKNIRVPAHQKIYESLTSR